MLMCICLIIIQKKYLSFWLNFLSKECINLTVQNVSITITIFSIKLVFESNKYVDVYLTSYIIKKMVKLLLNFISRGGLNPSFHV